MNIFQIETVSQQVKAALQKATSARQKLFLIADFFSLLEDSPYQIRSTYYIEFIDVYLSSLKNYSPLFLSPKTTEKILSGLDNCQNGCPQFSEEIILRRDEVTKQLTHLIGFLNGQPDGNLNSGKLYFPVLEEQHNTVKTIPLGLLECITIHIKKGRDEDKFIIIPSDKLIEQRISEQIEKSWKLALAYVQKQKKKLHLYHEIVIQFDNRAGLYVGNSLGVAITVGFIEQLLLFYNAPYTVFFEAKTASTGSMDEKGKILSVSQNIIEEKVEIVFFSTAETFIIPFADLHAAANRLKELKDEFPNRTLKLIAVEDLDDLLNRRNVVDIKKISLPKRTLKSLAKNKLISVVIFLLLALLSYFYLLDFDNNPTILDHDDTTLYVKNKFGKTLWTRKQLFYKPYEYSENFKKNYFRIIDIDMDGMNEVLVAVEDFKSNIDIYGKREITCYNHDGTIRWEYLFSDKVKTKRELFTENWNSSIMFDTTSIHGRKILICASSNRISFATAIYKLDLLTGKRVPGTFWHAGHCGNGFVKDLNNDGVQELVAVGVNNSFNHAGIIFVLQVDKLNGYAPSMEEYKFYEFPSANLLAYIKIPQTDLNAYLGIRSSQTQVSSLHDRNEIRKIVFNSIESPDVSVGGLIYILDYNLKDFNVVVSSSFAFARDELVKQKKLSPPFSDTKEYCDLIKSQILYWNGKEFVHRKDLK